MLAYVALTRCQVQLDPGPLADQLAQHGFPQLSPESGSHQPEPGD